MSGHSKPKFKIKWDLAIAVYAILFFAILLIANLDAVNLWLGKLLTLLSPLMIGLVIAYLANPFFRFFERRVFLRLGRTVWRRILSLILTYLILFSIIAGLIFLIIPQLISTVETFAAKFHTHMDSLVGSLNGVIASLNERLPAKGDGSAAITLLDKEAIYGKVSELWASVLAWLRANFASQSLPVLKDLLNSATRIFTDIFFGLFISVFFLASKEKRQAQITKFRLAYLPDSVNAGITRVVSIADQSFGGFLRGKILDSGIVGLLVYVTCLIFDIPYAILVAVIVGITDVIPVIGPFIGVIPTAVIILLTDPVKVIIYAIAILVIQQIDGNIIAPKILGENTGVSSLCVLIAILVMGDLMGLVGMLIGVPLFATVIELSKILLDKRLSAKGLSGDLDTYYAEETRAMVPEDDPPEEEPLEYPAPELTVDADPSGGNLSSDELAALHIFAAAQRHGIFSNPSEEALNGFRAELSEQADACGKEETV